MAVYFGIAFVMFTNLHKSSLQILPVLLNLEDLDGKIFGDKMGLLLHYKLLSFMFLKNINFSFKQFINEETNNFRGPCGIFLTITAKGKMRKQISTNCLHFNFYFK